MPKTRVVAGLTVLEILTGGARAEDPLPLVVFIHGLGDRPHSFVSWFARWTFRARVVLPQAEAAYASGYSWFPYPATEGELEAGVRRASLKLASALEELARERSSGTGVVVSGFSQGGMLSFALVALRPDLVAHAVPVSGLLPAGVAVNPEVAARKATVFALHGDADHRVSIAEARRSIATLKAAGAEAELREYPGVGHDISEPMRAELFARLASAASARP